MRKISERSLKRLREGLSVTSRLKTQASTMPKEAG